MNRKLLGLIKATHFGPTVLVFTISFFLSLTQFTWVGAFQVAAAILAGQCVVGWSNDLIDSKLDREANRVRKPLVAGSITESTLKRSISIALGLALVLSLIGPLGAIGTLLHFLGLLSATTYNLGLKKTAFSVVPYIVSFGAMPWAIYLANGNQPPMWLYLDFIFISSAFHFLNVVKDLEVDVAQGVKGLPQRLGKSSSIAIAFALVAAGVITFLIR
ncbi:MAG: UbiA family prenyltransferase [Actinobacteria bacterium]|nr:UbiA family prenyltransferase [Actinomycetota bacterium]